MTEPCSACAYGSEDHAECVVLLAENRSAEVLVKCGCYLGQREWHELQRVGGLLREIRDVVVQWTTTAVPTTSVPSSGYTVTGGVGYASPTTTVTGHPATEFARDDPPYTTRSGRVLTADDIRQLAEEAEAGYSIEYLRDRSLESHTEGDT